VGRSSIEQARESQRIIRDRYGAGLAGITDVLRAAAALLDADTERVAALADRITSEAHLRRALGRVP
jgi:outer membrane protein TolC